MKIFDDIDDPMWFYNPMHRDILDSHATLKSRIIRPNQPPYLNSALRKAAHRKAQLENKKNCFPNNINFEKFRVQRNKTTSIRRKAIKDFYNENCNQNCRTEPNYYKAAKLFMGSKGGYNAVGSIQLMKMAMTMTMTLKILYEENFGETRTSKGLS